MNMGQNIGPAAVRRLFLVENMAIAERAARQAPEFITAYRSAVGIREAEPEREALRISG